MDDDLVRQLERLSGLYASGALSADEFAAGKARLLAGAGAPAAPAATPLAAAASPGAAGRAHGAGAGAPRPATPPPTGANRATVPIVAALVAVLVIVAAAVFATVSSSASDPAASGPSTAESSGSSGSGSDEDAGPVSPGAGRSCPSSPVCINGGEGLVLGVVRATYEKNDVISIPLIGANTRIAGDRWLMKATLEIGNLSGSSTPVDLSGLQVITTSGSVADYFQSNSAMSIDGCPDVSFPEVVQPGQWVSPPEQLCFLIPAGDTPASLQFGTFGGEEPLPPDSF